LEKKKTTDSTTHIFLLMILKLTVNYQIILCHHLTEKLCVMVVLSCSQSGKYLIAPHI